jgi:hypothetical protein
MRTPLCREGVDADLNRLIPLCVVGALAPPCNPLVAGSGEEIGVQPHEEFTDALEPARMSSVRAVTGVVAD